MKNRLWQITTGVVCYSRLDSIFNTIQSIGDAIGSIAGCEAVSCILSEELGGVSSTGFRRKERNLI